MLTVHRVLGTWRDRVDAYVVLSDFARERFIQSGLPAAKLFVKPNFVDPDPGERTSPGAGGVFVGRLWPEKGAGTMVRAWRHVPSAPMLEIVGDGPEREALEADARDQASIRFLGRLSRAETLAAMKRAGYLVFPSEWYEGLPMTIVEAFACGVPVIASRLGTMAEVVSDGQTGLLFNPGDQSDLAAKVQWAESHPNEMRAIGRAARQEYEGKYTAGRNLAQLLEVYDAAMTTARDSRPASATVPDRVATRGSSVGEARG
jgi:glycosyltransferase involved in cell wall biosynthesis